MRLDDACRILGCDARCALEDVQKKYRQLALKHHPDRCPDDPGATAKFQTVGEAWERFQRWKKEGLDDPATDDFHVEREPSGQDASWFQSHFRSWFGQGGGGGGGGFGAAARCAADCECNFCRVERARAERRARAAAAEEARLKKAAEVRERDNARKEEAGRAVKEALARERRAVELAADERQYAAARAAREAEAAAERAKAEANAQKLEREKQARVLRKARARLRGLLCAGAALAGQVNESDVHALCAGLETGELEALCARLESVTTQAEAARGGNDRGDGAATAVSEAIGAMRRREEKEARLAASSAASSDPPSSAQRSKPPWTEQELSLLGTATKKWPGGTPERWTKVAELINHLASPSHARSADDVTRKVKEIRRALEQQKSDQVREDVRNQRAAQQRAAVAVATANAGTADAAVAASAAAATAAAAAATAAAASATPDALASGEAWSREQQRELEQALARFPASVGAERWDRIAEVIPGKTRSECVARYKQLASALKAKKAAAAAAAAGSAAGTAATGSSPAVNIQ